VTGNTFHIYINYRCESSHDRDKNRTQLLKYIYYNIIQGPIVIISCTWLFYSNSAWSA